MNLSHAVGVWLTESALNVNDNVYVCRNSCCLRPDVNPGLTGAIVARSIRVADIFEDSVMSRYGRYGQELGTAIYASDPAFFSKLHKLIVERVKSLA